MLIESLLASDPCNLLLGELVRADVLLPQFSEALSSLGPLDLHSLLKT